MVLLLEAVPRPEVESLLNRLGLRLSEVEAGAAIPGSYWGDAEAGLVANVLHARRDTPVHSVLHEASHYACMPAARRVRLHRDAGGDDLEESAVCYMQVLLSDHVPGMGRERMFDDMDLWGYSFRLGSARAWFLRDAGDAREWLRRNGLVDVRDAPIWNRREVRTGSLTALCLPD
jgi:hypothetical protein